MYQKCFIFDIGKVLINFNQVKFQHMIAAASDNKFKIISENWANPVQFEIETGKAKDEKYFNYYREKYGLQWTHEDWIKNYAAIYSINQQGRNLFLELKSKGYPVYILSNLAEYNKTAIDVRFPDFLVESTRNFYSYEIGLHKPDLKIYKTVCSEIGIDPENCFFIDDLEKNIKGAEAIGMNAHIFLENNIEQVKNAVQKFIS